MLINLLGGPSMNSRLNMSLRENMVLYTTLRPIITHLLILATFQYISELKRSRSKKSQPGKKKN